MKQTQHHHLSKLLAHTALLLCLCFGFTYEANATHFRGGTITWQPTGNPNEIQLKVTTSWRRSFYFGYSGVGSVVDVGTFYYGDGNLVSLDVTVISENVAEDWFTGEATFTHTYASAGNFIAYFESCCTLSSVGNGNEDAGFRIETLVNVGSGNTPPVTSAPTIINLPVNQNPANFNFTATDPDGDPFTFRFATTAESDMPNVNNNGQMTISPSGAFTFNTVGKNIGDFFVSALMVEDLDANGMVKSKVPVYILIRIVGSSTPPVFVAPTPPNNTAFSANPGVPLNFTVTATDADGAGNLGGNVTIQASGQPLGVTFTPSLPTPVANPVTTNVSWTPTLADVGSYVITFVAQDDLGIQTTTTVVIVVSAAPPFDVPPTPGNGSSYCENSSGTGINIAIQSTDFDANETVTLSAAIAPPLTTTPTPPFSTNGFAYANALPASITNAMAAQTATANTTVANINWNVMDADWGIYQVEYTATNTAAKSTTMQHTYIIDRAPYFTSVPPATPVDVSVGQAFSMTINATDDDIPFGDAVNFADAAKPYVDVPAWLTLTDNNNGTATLSGTPTIADLGINDITLEIHDRTTHYNHTHCTWAFFEFDINVIPCDIVLSGTPTNTSCPGGSDGMIDLVITSSNTVQYIDWDNDGTGDNNDSEDLSGLSAGTYNVIVVETNGCSATTSFTVGETPDTQPPTITCPPNVNVNTDPNSCNATGVTLGNPVTNDNCGVASTGVNLPLFYPLGTSNVTHTVTDNAGLSASCTQTVTVTDNENPTITCPANVNVNTDPNSCDATNVTLGNPTTNDNCGVAITGENAPLSFTLGTTNVTHTVTDNAGLSASCTQTVTVTDNENPTIICPANVNVNTDPNSCDATNVSLGNPTTNDNCGVAITGVSVPLFYPLGTSNVTHTVTDNAGLSASCTQTVTVTDNENPTITCPANVNVNTDPNSCDATNVTLGNPTTNDNCGVANVNNDAPLVFPFGTTTVTHTVTDNATLSVSCTQTVTVSDNEDPMPVCQNTTIQLDNGGNASITIADINNGSSDGCGVGALSLSQTAFDCSNVGANTVTLTVNDINGNSADCTATVTVEDNTAPMVNCQNVTVFLDGNGNASITPTQIGGGSTDACGIQTLSLDITDFDCSNIGTETVTMTATDINGNPNSCNATITIVNNVLPTMICQNVTAQLDANGIATVSANEVDNGSFTNCGAVSLQLSQSSFNCGNAGGNTVTLTGTGANGASANCSATVTVEDNIAPTALCQTAVVQLDANGNGSLAASTIDNGSNDNCAVTSLSLAPNIFGCADVGTNTVVLTATDAANNSSTCSVTIEVESNVPPTAVCNNLQVALDENGNVSVTGQDLGGSSTDACGIQSITLSQNNFDCSHLGQNSITVTVTNVNNNSSTCTSILTVIDDMPADILCRPPLNISTDANLCTATPTLLPPLILEENCDISNLIITNNAPAAFALGTTTVTWNVTDAGGNLTQCEQNVNVNDFEMPTISCPNGFTIPVQNDCEVSSSIMGMATAADNCGIASITNDAPSAFSVGNTFVTWTAVDNAGNSTSCNQAITVLDNEVPVFSNCPDEITIETDAATCQGIVIWDDLGATDNCGIAQISSNYNQGASLPIGVYTLQITALDNNGNATNCNIDMTIADTTPPELTCPDDMDVLSTDGQGVNVDFAIGMNDDCGIQILNLSHQSGDIFEVGNTTVDLTIADAGGNEVDCQFVIQVTPAVTVYCPEDIEVALDDNDNGQEIVTWNQTLASTICEDQFTELVDDLACIGWHNGHRYYITQVSDTIWGIAEEMAIQMGGHLAIINDEAENRYLTELMSTTLESAWIGLSDVYSTDNFTWVNGDPVTYHNWYGNAAPAPNEMSDGIVLQNDGTWITDYAYITRNYIIEVPVFEMYVNGEIMDENNIYGDSEDLFTLGTTTIDYLYVDECGYSNTCEFDVILEEATAEYCHAEGQILETQPYIESSVLNTTSFNNGVNEGYADYTASTIEMAHEDALFFSFTPNNDTDVHFWRVWIDWNGDGDFYDDNEQVMETKSVGAIGSAINIPAAMAGQETRIRVALSRVNYPESCGNLQAGEVEDYRLKIKDTPVATNGGGGSLLTVFPNPTNGDVTMNFSKLWVDQPTVTIVNSLGQVLWKTTITDSTMKQITLPTQEFKDGIYWVNIFDQGRTYSERIVVSKFLGYDLR